MVKVYAITYHLKNVRGLDYSSYFEGNCNLINQSFDAFRGPVTEELREMGDFEKINSYHFSDD